MLCSSFDGSDLDILNISFPEMELDMLIFGGMEILHADIVLLSLKRQRTSEQWDAILLPIYIVNVQLNLHIKYIYTLFTGLEVRIEKYFSRS
jgi:hypothetical protein